MDLRGKRAVVTGASAGIGRELSLQLADRGVAKVALLARRTDLLQEVAAECSAKGAKALAVRCDVTDRSSCEAAAREVLADLQQVDVLILNAGMSMGCYFEDIKDMSDGEKLMNLNVMGVANVLHYFLASMPKVRDSRIVVVSSVSGVVGVPFRTFYCASKWALHGFCAALRAEFLEAYGPDKAPKVVVTCPPEVGTSLNTNRLKFGNEETAQFDQKAALPVPVAAQMILDGTVKGDRHHFFAKFWSWIHTFYPCCPARIEDLIVKGVRKSHKAPRYGNM
ncbi:unnamed protein product [Effrenium voratum]|uniref:Ketoreductase domain-containing protein n=1 Tax=Effrenium voratum TaxID=2562239 RepID=A0AA36J0P8_9DINO|nr:unnamed protein product [Effrenium voratum]CAJ1452081.1 unnamed protein product [Effrenium voratum]